MKVPHVYILIFNKNNRPTIITMPDINNIEYIAQDTHF